ncbi:MAG: hypothetical protein QXS19_09140 [Candidatus Methanomethylicia archaeon]
MIFKVVNNFVRISIKDFIENEYSYIKVPLTSVTFITFSLVLAKKISENYEISVILINPKSEKEKFFLDFLNNNDIIYYTNENTYFVSHMLDIDVLKINYIEPHRIDYILRCIKEDSYANNRNKLYVGSH